MFEFLTILITKLESVLVPLSHTVLAEYVTEQSMYGSLNALWATIFWGVALVGSALFFICGYKKEWNADITEAAAVITVIAILIAIVLTFTAQKNYINEMTPTLQLLKTIL